MVGKLVVVAAAALALAACAGPKSTGGTTGAGGNTSVNSGVGGRAGTGAGGAGAGTGGTTTIDAGGSSDLATTTGAGGGSGGSGGSDGGGDATATALPIFTDVLSVGLAFIPFGGATNAVTIDSGEMHGGAASLRVEVPGSGYTGGAVVSGAPLDLSRYNAVTFWARSTATRTLNVVGFGNDGNSTTYSAEWNAVVIGTTWSKYVVPIPLPGKLTATSGLFHFAEGAEEGAYTVWFDDIQYETLNSSVLGPPAPAIATETLSKQTGDRFPVDGPSVTFSVNGGNQTIASARPYFTFATSNGAVATVDTAGTISAVGVGAAVITATLGATPATGAITVNVSTPSIPAVAAAPPTTAAADVISLLSGVYTNRTVDTWSASYDVADVADVAIAGVPTKRYSNLTFAGIEFFAAPAGPVDATAMTTFHLDVWTATASMLQVKLVDFGANAAYAGGDDTESSLTFDAASTPALATSAWVSLDIPLAAFTSLAARAHLAQLLLTANAGSTLFVENVYFHR